MGVSVSHCATSSDTNCGDQSGEGEDLTQLAELIREGRLRVIIGGSYAFAEIADALIREVLPLEAVLIQYLSRGARNKADVEDLRQDLYEKVCPIPRGPSFSLSRETS